MKRFLTDKSGATAIEYALIALLISLMLIAGALSIGQSLTKIFGDVANGFGGGPTP
jgi:pilus assembly protein Flp/PilA